MSGSVPVQNFHVMAKPTGPICNLDCKYCFYLEKENLYPDVSKWAMSEEVLENFIRQYIASQKAPDITFAWQGGEPTILGVSFFEKVVELEKKYADGRPVRNAFQTNGVLIDERWAAFLAENEFLVGVSIDGPPKFHDYCRVDKGGRPTSAKVMRAIELFKEHTVEFNTLTCVQRHNADHPIEVYRFLKEIGSGFMQFIPIIERLSEDEEEKLRLVSPDYDEKARVTPWSVRPLQYGKFLSTIFDEWVRNDVGQYFVQIFDIALEAWSGYEPSLCVFAQTCGDAVALEHNGDLYSCDHYVYAENRLGNIMENPVEAMVSSAQQRKFGQDKLDTLPKYCLECEVRFVCNGECPKHRFLKTPEGEPGLSYLCEGYKHFFKHIDLPMRFMANELRHQRAPANVMGYMRQQDSGRKNSGQAEPNDPCPCGSGRKFKKCCGRTA
jgi:uncharacterized protein